jgi:hypothetical protein
MLIRERSGSTDLRRPARSFGLHGVDAFPYPHISLFAGWLQPGHGGRAPASIPSAVSNLQCENADWNFFEAEPVLFVSVVRGSHWSAHRLIKVFALVGMGFTPPLCRISRWRSGI